MRTPEGAPHEDIREDQLPGRTPSSPRWAGGWNESRAVSQRPSAETATEGLEVEVDLCPDPAPDASKSIRGYSSLRLVLLIAFPPRMSMGCQVRTPEGAPHDDIREDQLQVCAQAGAKHF